MSFTLFIALYLLSLGLGYLIKALLNNNFPMSRWIWGTAIILLGVHLLMRNLDKQTESSQNDVWFSEQSYTISDITGYSSFEVVFGDAIVDLRQAKMMDSLPEMKITVLFGHIDVYLPDSIPYVVESDIGFGSSQGLVQNVDGFGRVMHTSQEYNEDRNFLNIRSHVIFGAIDWR